MATDDRPRRDDLREQVEEKQAELKESEENALEQLQQASKAGDGVHTVEVIDMVEVEVKDSLPGNIERKLSEVQAKHKQGNLDEAVDAMCEVCAELCITDGYTTKGVWKQLWDEEGTTTLAECLMDVIGPYGERQENIKDQHQFR